MPAGFAFAPNHMWIDIGENGCCDIGVDALFARVLGRVDGIRFVSSPGHARPRATITIDDLDLDLTFPLHLEILAANALLRVHPETMIADPYGAGWLFAARTSATSEQGSNQGSPTQLVEGGRARQWMRAECDRLARFVHDLQIQRCDRTAVLMSDGGAVSHGLWQHLQADEQRRLFNRFFAESNP